MEDEALTTLIALGRRVLAEADLEAVLERVLDVGRELTGARYAALGVLNPQRDALERFITRGLDPDQERAAGAPPHGRGVLGELIADPRPLRLREVAEHPRSYGFPAGHPPMHSFLGVPIVVDNAAWGNLYLTDKAGGEFSAEDEQAVEMLAGWAAIAIANARRLAEVRRRRDELERTVAALRATVDISRALAGEPDLDVVLRLIAERGRALVGARTLAIELTSGGRVQIAAAAGEIDPGILGSEVSLDGTVAGRVLETGRAERLSDERNAARFRERGLGGLGMPARAGLFVPLRFRNETPGVLVALDPEQGGDFTDADERLLGSFATSAASAVVTARSVTRESMRAREAAAEDERRRWARELHDETLQGLGALRMALSLARRVPDPAAALDDALAELDTEIANLRGIISDVRPAALDQLGLPAALDALAHRMGHRGIAVDLRIDLPTRPGEEVETAVYRIVQEGISNAIKHSGAEAVAVRVSADDGDIVASVHDEGRGFDVAIPAAGFGLTGMRERTEALEGTLTLQSAPGAGTTLTVRLPSRPR